MLAKYLNKIVALVAHSPDKVIGVLRKVARSNRTKKLREMIVSFEHEIKDRRRRADAVTPLVALKSLFSSKAVPVQRPHHTPVASRLGCVVDSLLGCFGFQTAFGLRV